MDINEIKMKMNDEVSCEGSFAEPVGSFWGNVFDPVKLLLEVSVVVFQLLDLKQCWLHVLFHGCIVLVSSFWYVLDKCLQVLFSFRLWKWVLFINNVLLDVFEGTVQLFDLFSFFVYYFVHFGDFLLEELLLLLELLLFVFSFKAQFLEFLFEFFAVGSIFCYSFLVDCRGFCDQKVIVLVLERSDFVIFGVKLFLVLFNFGLGFGGRVEIVFGGAGHQFIDVVKLRFGSELSYFLMKFLYFETIFLNCLIELFFEILDHSLLFPELLVFVIDDSLEGFDGLLCSLGDASVLLFVIVFNLFLAVEKSSSVGLELAAGELGLHNEWIGGNVHLATEIHELVNGGLRNDVLYSRLELMDLFFLIHKLLLEFSHFIKELFSILIIMGLL